MTGLVVAEFVKLRSTRTSAALATASLALALTIAALAALTADPADGDPVRVAFAAPGVAQAIALILGLLAVTTEFRHQTISQTLLIVPNRSRVLAAKLVVHALAGLALGLTAFGLATAVIVPVLASRGLANGLEPAKVLAIVAGGAIGTGLLAALGVALGALLRNQVGAVVGALLWLYVIEQLLALVPGLGDMVRKYGIAGLSSGLSGTASPDPLAEQLQQVPAGLLLTGYVLLALVAAAVALRRDITR